MEPKSMFGFFMIWTLICLMPRPCRSCYMCLTTPDQRVDLCRFLTNRTRGTKDSMTDYICLEMIKTRFQPISDLEIPHALKHRIGGLLGGFTEKIKKQDSNDWIATLEKEVTMTINEIKDIVSQNPPEPCKPPCGLQKQARIYKCGECVDVDCDLPLNCPIVDIDIIDGKRTNVKCDLPFKLPEDVTVVWKFASKVRAQDLSYFKTIFKGEDLNIAIKPARLYHIGTFACILTDDDDDDIGQGFYFVNVTKINYKAETETEDIFNLVINSDIPVEKEKEPVTKSRNMSLTGVIMLSIGCGLILMLVVVMVGAAFRYALVEEEHFITPP